MTCPVTLHLTVTPLPSHPHSRRRVELNGDGTVTGLGHRPLWPGQATVREGWTIHGQAGREGWPADGFPAVYMSCLSQNLGLTLLAVSNLSVRRFQIVLLIYPGHSYDYIPPPPTADNCCRPILLWIYICSLQSAPAGTLHCTLCHLAYYGTQQSRHHVYPSHSRYPGYD